jgi:dTMP kinase
MVRGLFISLEGGEGAGKSTMILRIRDYLAAKGHAVLVTREPGGIAIAEQIRSVILDRQHTAMDARTEALLYAAARRQHLVEKVAPAIHRGQTVLCDRFIDSSLAYQGYARGLGVEAVLAINDFAVEGMMPDLTLYLDISPEAGLARIGRDADREINRLDQEALSFHQKVREGYLQLVDRYSDRIRLIDADHEAEQVFGEIRAILDDQIVKR